MFLLNDRYLYTYLQKQNRLHLFGFIHPDTLTTFRKSDIKKRPAKIQDRILSQNMQYWLAPYNSG